MQSLVLGIDTGGTYTDGILMDYHSQEVLATTKSLTTHHDLALGILDVLDQLRPHIKADIRLVSISTTLATNAIAENKFRPVALFLMGYDSEMIDRFNLGTRFGTPFYYYFRGGHDLYGQEQAQPDLTAIQAKAISLQQEVEAFAVSAYYSPLNFSHEEQANEAIASISERPVVMGHQLSSRLDSIKRATTATLNASLLSVTNEFIQSMRFALNQRGIHAPLMIVRGDGALMNAAMTSQRPVETIHSGPAASAIGGRFLAGIDKGLIIDIGGTTTDIAIIDQGRVAVLDEGTQVGMYQTAIRSAKVRSFGLGGDSLLGFDSARRLTIGPRRVVPISYLAYTNPFVAEDVRACMKEKQHLIFPRRLEYWFLQREPRHAIKNDKAQKAVDLLRQHPLPLPVLLERLQVRDAHQFDGYQLIGEDILNRASFTPTDLLHFSGEYAPWDVEAARFVAQVYAAYRRWTPEELLHNMKATIAETIVAEVVSFISGQSLVRDLNLLDRSNLGQWMFEENLYHTNKYMDCEIHLKMPIIGMGAPASIFLPRVAKLLHTDLILPPHFEVANAIGAVAGNIMILREADLVPLENSNGFATLAGGERHEFDSLEQASAYLKDSLGKQAMEEALAMGATDLHLEAEQVHTGLEHYHFLVRAIGNPRLDFEAV